MELKILLIRSGSCSGEEALLSAPDKPLSPEGREEILRKAEAGGYPPVQLVYASALARARETANIIYPRIPAIVDPNLGAFNFGVFTGKSFEEVKEDQAFQAWASAENLLPPPGGEDPYLFAARCGAAFRGIAEEMRENSVSAAALVTHKSVIGAILQRYLVPRFPYEDWSTENGGGNALRYDTATLTASILQRF